MFIQRLSKAFRPSRKRKKKDKNRVSWRGGWKHERDGVSSDSPCLYLSGLPADPLRSAFMFLSNEGAKTRFPKWKI